MNCTEKYVFVFKLLFEYTHIYCT